MTLCYSKDFFLTSLLSIVAYSFPENILNNMNILTNVDTCGVLLIES